MFQKIKNLLKKHKNNIFVRMLFKMKQKYNNFKLKLENQKSIKRLKRLSKRKPIQDRKIRVVFVVVNSNTWNKLKSLYYEMLNNDKIDVKIVCCPEPYKEDTSITYNYFKNNGYDCIDARVGEGPWNALENKGKWFNLKNLEPDYVFYSEPYNIYLPKKYKSNEVSKYAKICLTMYGMILSLKFMKDLKKSFFSDVYCYYASNNDDKSVNEEYFKTAHDLKLQKTKNFGYLAFEDVIKNKNINSESWNFSKNKIRAIWTPRWTLDESVGGSNFFRYKDVLFDYANKNADIDLLFRPHPMAFDNFIRTGKMTVEEVAEFKKKCEISKNINLDSQKEYNHTFWGSDFLITDNSSIIVEYFITGKPIIYCVTENFEVEYLPYFKKLLSSCYIVNNEEELINKINDLKENKDDLKELRDKYISEIFGDDFESISKRITKDIVEDSMDKK